MLVFGSKTKNMGEHRINGQCKQCRGESLVISCYQRVIHFFYIPTLPLKKYFLVECLACDTSTPCSPALLEEYKINIRTPLKAYIGLFVLAALIGFGGYSEYTTSQHTKAYMSAPHSGVYLTIKADNGRTPYMLAKVDSISGDKVTLTFDKYSYSQVSMARDSARDHTRKKQALDGVVKEITLDEFKHLDVQQVI